MSAVLAVLLLSSALLLGLILYVGVRSPRRPRWMGEEMIANVHAVAIVGLMCFGVAYALEFALTFGQEALGARELAFIGADLAVLAVAVKLLRVRERVAAYEARRGTDAAVLAFPTGAAAPEKLDDPDRPPAASRVA